MIILLSILYFAYKQRQGYLRKMHTGQLYGIGAVREIAKFLIIFFGILCSDTVLANSGQAHQLQWSQVEVRSTGSGNWSDPAIWNDGRIPAEGDNVVIDMGHRVIYDVQSEQAIRLLHIRGELIFSDRTTTQLDAGMIIISMEESVDPNANCSSNQHTAMHGNRARLQVGSPFKPIPNSVTARIRLVDFSDIDDNCGPAIISYGGIMDFHGAPMKHTWLKLNQTAPAGTNQVVLTDAVDWRVGDRVIITGTIKNDSFKGTGDTFRNSSAAQTEQRRVAAVSGQTVTLDAALQHDHIVDGEFRAEMANLSRNVIIESRDPDGVRGHTMYHHGSRGSISYAEFAHLGKNGLLARYPIHYHLLGSSNRGSSVIGASIWDSHNRWITVHGTNYLVVRDCVGFQSLGHGYFMEDASEVYNLFDHNLAVHGYTHEKLPNQALEYDENAGAGFWWANGRNAFIKNTAVECDQYGYQFEIPADITATVLQPDGTMQSNVQINRLPFILFKNNEAHGMRMYGFWGDGDASPTDPFIIENFRSWKLRYGISPNGRYSYLNNLNFWDINYGYYGKDPHDAKVMNINGKEIGSFLVDIYEAPQGLITVENVFGDVLDKYPLRITGRKSRDLPCDVHIRNYTLTNVEDNLYGVGSEGDNAKANPDLTMYLHDFFGAGRDAKVIPATQSRNDGLNYQIMTPPFSENVKVAEVSVDFPDNPIKPQDSLPPATVITFPPADQFVPMQSGGSLTVRGTCIDQSKIASLTVNGQEVTPLSENYLQWQVTLTGLNPGELKLVAEARDEHGNREGDPHEISVTLDASTAVRGVEHPGGQIEGFALYENYPNPFNPQTTVSFELPNQAGSASHVQLRIYDILSQHVQTLANDEFSPGLHRISWQGTDANGTAMPSGVYFYELIAKNTYGREVFRQTRKMILSK